jgi:long-chain acyl-CoA synthetase
MQVEQFLEISAAKYPGKTALVCGGRRVTYAQLDEQANRLAHALLAGGVQRGDRVVVHLENGIEAVASIFAILKAGAVFCVVHPSTKRDKLRYIGANSKAAALISANADATWKGTEDGGNPLPPGNACIDADLAALIYTSGTTGKPKGVMLTHLNMSSAATSVTSYLENNESDIILNGLPISSSYGLYQVLTGLLVGATVVLLRSFAYPYTVIETLIREQVTGFPIVPTIAAILLDLDLAKHSFPSLRYITNAGAALPVAHVVRIRQAFPSAKLYSMYGQTECKRISYLQPDQLDIRPDSIGKGMPNQELYLVDEQGTRVAPGQTGELVVRGSHVMKGYWDMPSETDKVLRPGPVPGEKVLHTGDLFRMDDDGYLYFVSRRDDLLKTGGYRVSPREIEEVLHQMPSIAEAVVVGKPDPVLGQAIHAIVRMKDGAELTERQVQLFCSERLEDYLVPKSVEFRSELPRTAAGKTSRREYFSSDVLQIDAAKMAAQIEDAIRQQMSDLKRKGVVVGLSGGIDSSVVATLAARALGKNRVLGLFMPEKDSSGDSLRLGRMLAASIGIETQLEAIGPIVEAAGCYRRRDGAIQTVVPDYNPQWRSKIVLPNMLNGAVYPIYSVIAESPSGERHRARLTAEAYLQVVAATNFKQRTRKMIEYYWADRLRYAVAGTPNKLEYELGFFVKNGDGSADIKPIAHLYKSQVYQLADYLGIPEEIRKRQPTTDTYSLPQSQEEFFFAVSYDRMDLCLYGQNGNLPADRVAEAIGMSGEEVQKVYEMIGFMRRAAHYLLAAPQLIQ